jgi:ABC-2 type transport system permease protein
VSAILAIAGKDLRLRLRDRSALILGFVAPLVIAALMSFAFRATETFHTTVGVVDTDRGELAQAFDRMLASPELSGMLTVRQVASQEQARQQVDDGTLGAAFVLPDGFTAAAHGGAAVPVTVLASVNRTVDAQVCRSLAESFTAQLNADRLSVAAALAAGAPPQRAAQLAAASAALRLPEQIRPTPAGSRPLATINYYGPAMGIFFMLFAIGFGARGWFAEQQAGTLDRIAAAPVRPAAVLAGKSLSTFCYGVASLTTMAVVTSVAFHADWGPPLGVAALIGAMGVALVALTALVTAGARTERQADGLASVITFALVLLGGNFVFLAVAPALLRRLALLTPNGWALRGFTDLATGAGAGAAGVPVLAILAFAAAAAGLAAALSRRVVTR